MEAEEVLEVVVLVVVALGEADFAGVPQHFDLADLGQVECHLAELVPHE